MMTVNSGRESRSEYQRRVATRKADPEAKRARDDKKFRKLYLARLRRREAAARRYDDTTLDGILHRIDSHDERADEIREVMRLRAIAMVRKSKSAGDFELCTDGTIVRITPSQARKAGACVNMTGKNARLIACRQASHQVYVPGKTYWRNGVPKRYTRAKNDNFVRSIGLIVDPQTFDYILHTTRQRIVLPDGYMWSVNLNGLRIVHGPDDYHPTGGELITKHAMSKVIARLQENRERRRRLEAENAAIIAESQGVFVCVADSIRAGNCPVGTLEFAERHDLDPAKHYPAGALGALLELANGDASRVRLVIKAACKRHAREEQQGFCVVSEHT